MIALAILLVATAGCKKTPKPDPVPSCVGEWQLSQIETKSVSYAGQTVDVYVSFLEEGTFELYQMVGQGRFRKYTGSWSLDGSVLSGTYSNKKAWGSTYQVSGENGTLVLTSEKSGEVDTYRKTSIPESVKAEAYEL